MLDFLRELVNQSSESKDSKGVLLAQNLLSNRLKNTGAEITWIEPEVPGFAPALLASWGAVDKNEGLCLVSHADTVYACEDLKTLEGSDGERLLGGGVADNKGGLAIATAAIEKLFHKGLLKSPSRPLYLFSSSCEELGSPAFQRFIKNFSFKLDYVLGMEPALPNGDLIKKRRGNRYYSIKILGNSVHTGRDLSDAANPIQGLVLLNELIESLKKEFPQIGLSLNGIKSHPFKYNMSPDSIEVNMDLRFEKQSDVLNFHEKFSQKLPLLSFHSKNQKNKGKLSFEIVDDCPAFDCGDQLDESLHKLLEFYSTAESEKINFSDGLGASDCCYFYREELKIVDGLGPRGGKIHSPAEFVVEKSLEQRASGLENYLSWFLAK